MTKRPNILMIVTDQHRYDCIGYSNEYPVKTPNLDKLSKDGMSFHNAYTNIPLCCPARQSLLSGKRNEVFGAYWNYNNFIVNDLDKKHFTFTKALKEVGYNMAYIGKWHVSPTYTGLDFGYDYFIDESEYFKKFRKVKYPDVEYTQGFKGETDPIPLEDSKTHWYSDRVVEKLNEYSDKKDPWHIRFDLLEPHLPCRPAGRFASMYDPKDIPKWHNFDETFENKPYIQKQVLLNWGVEDYTWEDWSKIVARYYGIISQVDDAIGRVIDHLKKIGQYENTIIIYTTDHGDMCGAHKMMDKHHIMYEDVVKVPMIVKWDGVVEKNSQNHNYVYNTLDMAPTIVDIIGREIPHDLHGKSMLPLLKKQKNVDWRTEVISTYNGQQHGLYMQRMIKIDGYKYIWNPTDIDEFYNLTDDPGELNNEIYNEKYSKVIKNLRIRLYEILKNDGDDLVRPVQTRRQLLEGRKL